MTDANQKKSDRYEQVGAGSDKYKLRNVEEKTANHAERIGKLEGQINEGVTMFKVLQLEMGYLKTAMEGVKSAMGKVGWAIVLAVLVQVLASIFKGHV